jgi:DNA polymerase/3'-5' exonuclease PolX
MFFSFQYNCKMTNEKIIKMLQHLITYYEEKGQYQAIVYKKAVNVIKKLPEITDVNDIPGGNGIGPGIKSKIDEILKTGNLSILEDQNLKIKVIEELCTIRSIGPKTAGKMYDAGIRSIKDLTNYKLTAAQQLGLKYRIDLNKRVPREYITQFHEYIKSIIPKKWNTDIVGSYRRGLETSGDIDLLISADGPIPVDIDPLITKLRMNGYLVGSYSKTSRTMSGIIMLNGMACSLDIKSYTTDEKPFALLYFTGSGNFNVIMRTYALKHGFKLSDTSLIDEKTGTMISCKTEKSIFAALNLPYVKPVDRL